MFAQLRALADRAALYSALRQDQLIRALEPLGDHRWDVDLEAGTFTFASNADPERTVVARPHLIASIAPGPRSLMWAWALPQGDPTGAAGRLRAYGEEHGIEAFVRDEVPFPNDTGDNLDTWIDGLAHAVGAAAVEVTGLSPYYAASAGGSRAVLLLDAPIEPLTVAGAVTVLPRILSMITLPDARTAVWDAARLAGWNLQWTDESFTGAAVSDASGSATFRFDEQARITGIEGSLGTA